MPVRAVLLLLSKVTQKHFRQPYRPSKVPLHPARSFSSLRSVCLCPVISLPEYIPGHHDTVCPPDTSSAQHPFPSGSVPIYHPAKSAGIPHNAIRYQSISPITRCHIFRYYCCNQAFPLSLSSLLSRYIQNPYQGCPESWLPFRCLTKTSVLTSATFPCLPFIQERATPLSYGIQRRITIESQPVFLACPDTPGELFPVLPLLERFLISYIIHVPP